MHERTDGLRRWVFYLMIPVDLVLIVWVWIGRAFFGVPTGWMPVIMLFMGALPVVLVFLVISTGLAFAQPSRPLRLTNRQAWAQLTVWLCMLVTGATIGDFTDASGLPSLLSFYVGGGSTLDNASWILAYGSAAAGFAAWCWLVVLLVKGRSPSPTR